MQGHVATHIRIMAILHIVMGALGVLGGVALLAFFGGLAGLVGASDQSGNGLIAIPILGGIGGILFIVMAALSLPSLIVGIGLLQLAPWSRIGGIVLSVLHLFNVPVGTALGIYGLWALLSPEGEALFRTSGMSGAPSRQPIL